MTISLCMIVKNEENVIARCLSSVESVVDEIIVVDTGSTDRTKELAAAHGAKVFDFEWIDDFSAARNFSYEQATMDYIMWLDADDILLPDDAAKLRVLKNTLPQEIDSVMLRYNTGFDSNGRVTFSYFRERLTKRGCGYKWREPVHEYLETGPARFNAEISVTHMKPHGRPGGRNLAIYESTLAAGKGLSPRGMYYYARELRDNGRNEDAVMWYTRFLDGGLGWVEDNITACGDLANCYLALGKQQEALAAMLRSLYYDTPRAELCCQLGYFFKSSDKYRQAAYWFGLALTLERDRSNWGFSREDCWGYIPCIELAVCLDKLGEYEKAAVYNERALGYKPDSAAALGNREYFKGRLTKPVAR